MISETPELIHFVIYIIGLVVLFITGRFIQPADKTGYILGCLCYPVLLAAGIVIGGCVLYVLLFIWIGNKIIGE